MKKITCDIYVTFEGGRVVHFPNSTKTWLRRLLQMHIVSLTFKYVKK